MHVIDLDKAKSKHVPTEEERKEILEYLQAHPDDETAFDYLKEKYNCSEFSIFEITVSDILKQGKK